MTGVAAHWDALVGVALLGADRRDPPDPPPGPISDLVADLAAGIGGDEACATPAGRLLTQVAAVTAARRAGSVAAPPATALAAPRLDPRPVISPAASRRWRTIVAEWPVLEDEWFLELLAHRWRLAPELVVAALVRHRRDGVRRARVVLAAGPLADWLVEHEPTLAGGASVADPIAVASLPELAVTPELAVLDRAAPAEVAAALAAGFAEGRFGLAHRGVLVNLVARVHADALAPIVARLSSLEPATPSVGLAAAVADLARTRHDMLAELEPQ